MAINTPKAPALCNLVSLAFWETNPQKYLTCVINQNSLIISTLKEGAYFVCGISIFFFKIYFYYVRNFPTIGSFLTYKCQKTPPSPRHKLFVKRKV